MLKALGSLATIAICAVLLFFGYQYFYAKPLQNQINITKNTIVTQLILLSNIETARMSLQKNVEGKQGLQDLIPGQNWDNIIQNFLFQDSLQITAYAEIVAGFNLSKLQSGAITVNPDKSVTLTLPQPEILSATLTKDTKPFIRKRGILTNGDLELESDIRNKTLEVMTQDALSGGILKEATKNALPALAGLIQGMGYTLKDVTIQSGSVQL